MNKKLRTTFILIIAFIFLFSSIAQADEGVMFRKNISKTPDQETDRANINHMAFYVPAQTAAGEVITITYEFLDGTTMERDYAKPLIAVYIDAYPEEEEEGDAAYQILSGAGWGKHDAYAAASLDDGATWKDTNLSESAHLSSFYLANGTPYPGDSYNMTFAIAGDKVLVGWISKYCDGGTPAYTLTDDEGNKLYPDIWGVAGSQNSVDYTLQGHPEVGEIPYSCVWSARGTLLLDDETDTYDLVWTKAERLTSGRRDANRLEMAADSAAGFMMVWQEDPEGLRPGQGLGPGEGWSGAVVNGQTDLWYSYISIEDFEQVWEDDTRATAVSIYEYEGETMPKVAAPMALPIRLTDNAMCKAEKALPYCYINFQNVDADGNYILPDNWEEIEQSPDSTYCTDTVSWDTGGGATLTICIAKDGRVMQGRVGASRPRVNVQPYATTTVGDYDSAWVILGAEESKALGEGAPADAGGGQPDEEEPPDIGKNMWYYSFDLLNPDFVMQGGMLNQPAQCSPYDVLEGKGCNLGEFMLLEDPLYEGNEFYETEISRRFSHMSQPIHQIGPSGVSSVLIVKQGILNQGGPADIFLRFTQVPDDVWVECPAESEYDSCLPVGYNPYAYENMACDDWVFQDGSNPRYLQGLCLSTPVNVSGTTIVECDSGTPEWCAANFPWEGGESPFPKVTWWEQTEENLSDQAWANPYDVAKGHRGFIDGDFIMIMYAWSPNWKANSVGNDKYNLYVRRSFDGGQTWTTTPAAWGGDGVVGDPVTNPTACENYGVGSNYETVCFNYAAGEFEQARNVSQLTGNKETILDPRYTPTGGLKMLPITDLKGIGFAGYDDDERDPSKFFIVYETGDNTTVAEGEAEPMDLFYSRATNYGDDYFLVEYPTGDGSGSGETSWGFPWLENKADDMSGEAANTCNNGGTFYYVVWNQWQEDEHENVSESDAIFRRLMFRPDEDGDGGLNIPPLVNIHASHTYIPANDTEVTFIGLIYKVYGDKQIVAWKWTSSLDGEIGSTKSLKMRGNQLSIGQHTISLSAQDSAGLWSKEVSVPLQVGSKIFIPVVNH
jgi:hypothetical protein